MVDQWPRIIRYQNRFEYLRGGSGVYTPTAPSFNRDTLVYGTYAPTGPTNDGDYSQATAGIYGPSTLTTDSSGGPLTIGTTANNTTISNTDFYRAVVLAAGTNNITFVNCRFWGSPTENREMVTAFNGVAGTWPNNITFIDCTFCAMAPQWKSAAVRGFPRTSRFVRCDVFNCTDGIFINPGVAGDEAKVTIEGCYFHDAYMCSPDPDAAGGFNDSQSHVDIAVQFNGGDLTFIGNNCQMFATAGDALQPAAEVPWPTQPNATERDVYHFGGNAVYPNLQVGGSCIMMSPALRPLGTIRIDKNIFDGGTACINVNPSYTGASGGFVLSNNKCGTNHTPGTAFAGTPFIAVWSNTTGRNSVTGTGNVRLDNGAALSLTQIVHN